MNNDSDTMHDASEYGSRPKSRFAKKTKEQLTQPDQHIATYPDDFNQDGIEFPTQLSFSYTMEILSGQFYSSDFMNIKFDLILNGDWKLSSGTPTGITHCASPGNFKGQLSIFNFIERFAVSTTNLLNFPQIILTVYGIDFFGRPVIKGYGVFYLTCTEGVSVRRLKLFRPLPSSWIVGLMGKLKGKNPEYVNPVKTLIGNHGRKFTTVEPIGWVDIKFDLIKKGWSENGFI
jgi:B9 domain-containing protein 1